MNSSLDPNSAKKELNLQGKIKEDFKEWLSSSTSHGLPNIARTDSKILRLLWTVSFLASTAACAYLLYLSVIGYLNFDVVTKISVYDEVPSQFPTVTICNSYPFGSDNSTPFLEEKFKIFFGTSDLNLILANFESNYFLFVKYLIWISAADPSLSDDFKKSLGLTIDDMLISCQFSGYKCSKDDFVWFYSSFYGSCYKFNSGKNSTGGNVPLKSLNQIGKINGLRLELYMGHNNKPFDFINPTTGAHIFISNYTVTQSPNEGLDAATSKETNIAVRRTLKYRLPSPYSDCIDDVYDENASDSFFFKSIVKSGIRYRFTDCLNLCFLRSLKEKCGCYDINLSNIYNVRPCINLTDVSCDFYAFTDFFKSDVQQTCGPDCPVECNSEFLSFSTGLLEYPSIGYGNFIKNLNKVKSKFPNNSVAFEELKQSTLAINVYYDDLKYTVIEESASMDLITLIAGMGGTLGLFIGVSFLSFVEIFEILVRILFIYNEEKTKKQNRVFDYNNKF
jgi:amiloride-sensitive sodium channel subunit alpha/amiloride-sensitive sodium channel subunit gamma